MTIGVEPVVFPQACNVDRTGAGFEPRHVGGTAHISLDDVRFDPSNQPRDSFLGDGIPDGPKGQPVQREG